MVSGFPASDSFDELFAFLYLGSSLGIGFTCLFIPSVLGGVGLLLAVRDHGVRPVRASVVAMALNALALVVGTWAAATVWLTS